MTPVPKRRLDELLVERGLAESREKAKALILAGQVLVDGQRRDKPAIRVPEDTQIELLQPLRYVSRGGYKLELALDHFGLRVEGKVCLDVGASTGGFTDCLLQRGAARVHAVDVGHGQLAWKLRQDPRVVVHERLNARYLKVEDLGELVDLATIDVSFISVALILPAVSRVLKPRAELLVLIKPQFEVGKGQVGKGGIVRDPELHRLACAKVQAAVEELGFRAQLMEDPVEGAEGNKEFFLYGVR